MVVSGRAVGSSAHPEEEAIENRSLRWLSGHSEHRRHSILLRNANLPLVLTTHNAKHVNFFGMQVTRCNRGSHFPGRPTWRYIQMNGGASGQGPNFVFWETARRQTLSGAGPFMNSSSPTLIHPEFVLQPIQGGWSGCRSRKKLSSSQAQRGQATYLAVASFLSVFCPTSTPSTLYTEKERD